MKIREERARLFRKPCRLWIILHDLRQDYNRLVYMRRHKVYTPCRRTVPITFVSSREDAAAKLRQYFAHKPADDSSASDEARRVRDLGFSACGWSQGVDTL